MKTAALVPVKCLTRANRRLRTEFSDLEVEALARAMLCDVLDALRPTSLARIEVLTADSAVRRVAEAAGAEVRSEVPDPGLNAVVDRASVRLAREGFDASLVVLGDLPLLRPAHVEAVLAASENAQVVVVPAADGGTAMLLRSPAACLPAQFGVESGALHLRRAFELGLRAVSLTSIEEEVRVDLDTPEDARRLVGAGVDCRTRRALEEMLG